MSQEHKPPHAPHPLLAQPDQPLPAEVGALVVRQPTPREEVRQRASVDSAYGFPFRTQEESFEQHLAAMAPLHNRRIVAEQLPGGGERIIGGDIRFDMRLSLPGGGRVPVGALSAVGVEPGANGRGALRALVEEHLDDCRSRGEAASVLMASQTPLYPRYGYGLAVQTANWEIDAHRAGLRADAPSAGRVMTEHARGERLHEVLNEAWEAASNVRAGGLSRSPVWWHAVMGIHEGWPGGGPVMVARHTDAPGYVLYTVKSDVGRQGLSESSIAIREVVAPDAAVELDLWRYVVGLPWARTITWHYAPIDPAARFWLVDARQLRCMAQFDFLWLRPLDMAALVAGRTFAADGTVRFQVEDARYADLAGSFDLRVEGGAGLWVSGTGPADLHVSTADLGSLWLGGTSAAQLHAVHRIAGDAAAARGLDAMLATAGPPRCMTRF